MSLMDVVAGAHIHPGAAIGEGASVMPGAYVGDGVVIGAGSEIGPGAIVLDGTRLGSGCVVEATAVLGKRPRLRAGSSAAGRRVPELVIGDGVTVCAGAIVYAGARIGPGVIIGDQAQVRERVVMGERTVIGRASCIDVDSTVGERVLIQTAVYICGSSVIENDVFVGPGVVTTNDDTMDRGASGDSLRGPTFRRACRVGGGAVTTPGVTIGEEAFVAAGALITHDVPAREVVMGVPARAVRRVPDEQLIERWR